MFEIEYLSVFLLLSVCGFSIKHEEKMLLVLGGIVANEGFEQDYCRNSTC